MQNNVGLVLLTKQILNNPDRRWDAVEETVKHYHNMYDRFSIYLCGNGPREKPTEEVAKHITSYDTFPRFDVQKLVQMGLQHAINSDCKYSLVINGPLICPDLSFMDDGKLLVRAIVNQQFDIDAKTIESDFMFGKTRSLMRIWTNRPFDRIMTSQQNMYKNISNLLGRSAMYDSNKVSMRTADDLQLKRAGW